MTSVARKKLVQGYYSARAEDYDRQKSRTWKSDQGFGTEVLEEVFGALEGFDNKIMLEVGIGSGRNAKPLLEKVKPLLVGLDLTTQMLAIAKSKLRVHRQCLDLVLGDAESLPFIAEAFDAILCISTMHYFTDQETMLKSFLQLLKKTGTLVYGDMSPHESDNGEFFEKLERTVSRTHARYYKASEMKELLETHGFHISRMKTVAYRKSYDALIQDKGRYFGIKLESLRRYVRAASKQAKVQYSLTDNELTLFYTIITATRKNCSV